MDMFQEREVDSDVGCDRIADLRRMLKYTVLLLPLYTDGERHVMI